MKSSKVFLVVTRTRVITAWVPVLNHQSYLTKGKTAFYNRNTTHITSHIKDNFHSLFHCAGRSSWDVPALVFLNYISEKKTNEELPSDSWASLTLEKSPQVGEVQKDGRMQPVVLPSIGMPGSSFCTFWWLKVCFRISLASNWSPPILINLLGHWKILTQPPAQTDIQRWVPRCQTRFPAPPLSATRADGNNIRAERVSLSVRFPVAKILRAQTLK